MCWALRQDRPMHSIRRYRPGDLERLREICVRTALRGGDASGVLADDSLWPAIYLDPYLESDPGLAFVAVAGGDAGDVADGYIVACADTAAFLSRYRDEWVPQLSARFGAGAGAGAGAGRAPNSQQDRELRDLAVHPERMLRADLGGHPAHLHIDLLPEAQGRGLGRALMDALLAELRTRGVAGVHLGVDPENTGARAFYEKLGFEQLPQSTVDAPLYGIATAAIV